MRDKFPGYYRPSEDEFKELWKSALVVPDTNVLLTLYRLSDTTRKRLLDILEALKERLFLPYQVGYEFQENRVGVIKQQKAVYDSVLAEIKGFPGDQRGGTRRCRPRPEDLLHHHLRECRTDRLVKASAFRNRPGEN